MQRSDVEPFSGNQRLRFLVRGRPDSRPYVVYGSISRLTNDTIHIHLDDGRLLVLDLDELLQLEEPRARFGRPP